MLVNASLALFLLLAFASAFVSIARVHSHNNHKPNGSTLAGIEFPEHMSFNAVSSSSHNGCGFGRAESTTTASAPNEECDEEEDEDEAVGPQKQSVKLHLRHEKNSVFESTIKDLTRIQTLHTRIVERKNQNTISRLQKDKKSPTKEVVVAAPAASPESYVSGSQLEATLKSGVSLGSGEYFMDVFIGTPPKHFSLILDTGSDLNWIQCAPCYDCFEQNGPHYDPKDSTSFSNIGCHDPKCQLVSSPEPPQPCKAENQTCPYFYWYGDSSNTTGDFALETFTVNLTSPAGKAEYRKVENVMFGCGHWNRGLFHGAAGLLGLGRGPLSFASQLQSLYGHSFSYCLVDRNSDTNVSSKLIFGEDKALLSHPQLNYTSLVAGIDNPVDTFYYVQIKSILVGGEVVKIPEDAWKLSSEGAGGTIIDSGTTLSYFADPAYEIIKEAFLKKIKGYPVVKDFPVLDPCYNVSGVEKLELPEFAIVFADGAVWDFPVENYFIQIEPQEVICLAILGTPKSALSIIGNYQQQNFHILYDTKKSRLGYAPMNCLDNCLSPLRIRVGLLFCMEVACPEIEYRSKAGQLLVAEEREFWRQQQHSQHSQPSLLLVSQMAPFRYHQYQVVGRALPTEKDEHPKIFRMKLWHTNEVRAKSKFWYFLRKLKKVKKSNGQILAINEIFEKNPTTINNYGIWLRYQSRTGYHNMYKEYRNTTLNGAVEDMYTEMASRHRVRSPCIQIIKTATIPAKLCKRESTKQFHNSKIKFPLVLRKIRPPSRKLKTTYKASRPNIFM
ncbi:uncharacterized protein LOC126797243 [Argentina anserina]|uniref:uncharacterized protein LOC126797243 n=2 Tax=Rosoideae TaxID=171638 RepID=UPI0021763C4A|nr:uncharacterized protein LOC126797243 [Potentilla anserina]